MEKNKKKTHKKTLHRLANLTAREPTRRGSTKEGVTHPYADAKQRATWDEHKADKGERRKKRLDETERTTALLSVEVGEQD